MRRPNGRQGGGSPPTRPAAPPARWLAPTGLLAFALAVLIGNTLPADAQPLEPARPVRQVVLDIISFTRWPQLPAELHLCIVGQASHAAEFFGTPIQVGHTPVIPTLVEPTDPGIPTTCDIVYEGALSRPQRDTLVQSFTGRPILTIGEAVPGCIEVTMFCLNARGQNVSFSANIDAIAHSGVRLNPQVIMLGRRGPPRV